MSATVIKHAWGNQTIEALAELQGSWSDVLKGARWQEVALLIDESSRVYGARVDNLHVNAHRTRTNFGNREFFFLTTLEEKSDQPNVNLDEELGKLEQRLQERAKATLGRHDDQVQIDETIDPYFQRVRSQIERGAGESGLLLNLLPANALGGVVWAGTDELHKDLFEPKGLRNKAHKIKKLVPERICPGLDGFSEELKEIELSGPPLPVEDDEGGAPAPAAPATGTLLRPDERSIDEKRAAVSLDMDCDAFVPYELEDGLCQSVQAAIDKADKIGVDDSLQHVSFGDYGFLKDEDEESEDDQPIAAVAGLEMVTPSPKKRKAKDTPEKSAKKKPRSAKKAEAPAPRRAARAELQRLLDEEDGVAPAEREKSGFSCIPPTPHELAAIRPDGWEDEEQVFDLGDSWVETVGKAQAAPGQDAEGDAPEADDVEAYMAELQQMAQFIDPQGDMSPRAMARAAARTTSRYIDVREVKRLIRGIKRPADFKQLLARTALALPPADREKLSPGTGFVCLLHLCTEESWEIDQHAPLGDFTVR